MWSKTLFQIQYGKYNKSLPQGAIAVLIVAAEPLAG